MIQHVSECGALADDVAKFMGAKLLALLGRPLVPGDPLLDCIEQVLIIERLG